MPNVRFNLKSEPDPRLIYLAFRVEGKKFQYSTSQKIPARFWDKDKCRARVTRQFPAARALNDLLDTLERTCQDAYRDFIRDRYGSDDRPTWKELRGYLRRALDEAMMRDIASEPEKDFFAFVEALIEERDKLPEWKPGTVSVYRTTLKHLREFERQWRKRITFETIDLEFAADFREYLYGKGISTNHVHNLIQRLRVFLNEATERGINENMAFKSKRFQIQKESVQDIYLTVEELAQFYHLDFTHPYQQRTRDAFIIGAFTGLRYSDFTAIKPENLTEVDGTRVIQITTKKTGQRVTVPVHPFVSAILERNGGAPPRRISNQKMNEYLKECAQLAPWGDDLVPITRNRGGRRYTVNKKKWRLVTTHTARRSFATNAYKAGVPSITIMSITGHKTEKEFLKYIKVGSEEHARIMAGHEFFRKGVFRVG